MCRVLDWFEKHAGLGGWVGALGVIVAILVAWGLARAEYLRTRRLETARLNAQITLFERITAEFQPIVLRYLQLANANDREAIDYRGKQIEDVRWLRAVDLNSMPVTGWPSVESYDAFKRYFLAAMRLLETSPLEDARPIMESRKQAFEGSFEQLQQSLENARRQNPRNVSAAAGSSPTSHASRGAPMVRRLLLNSWLWASLSGFLLVVHAVWAWRTCSGIPLQRVGAPLIVIGIVVAARTFIRAGLSDTIQKSLPRTGVYPSKDSHRIREAALPETKEDTLAIQVLGPILLIFGTALSGYGDLLVNCLGKVVASAFD